MLRGTQRHQPYAKINFFSVVFAVNVNVYEGLCLQKRSPPATLKGFR